MAKQTINEVVKNYVDHGKDGKCCDVDPTKWNDFSAALNKGSAFGTGRKP